MGKILFTEHNESGDIHYIAGRVAYVSPGTGIAKGNVTNIGVTLDVYNKEQQETERNYLNVAFWNNEKRSLADAIIKAKVKPGDFLIIVTGEFRDSGENKNGVPKKTANGFGFNFSRKLEVNSGRETIIHGKVVGIFEKDSEKSYVTVAVSGPDKSKEEYSIMFPKKDANGNVRNLNKRISIQRLKKGSTVSVLTGPVKDNEGKDGKTYHNAIAYDFVVGWGTEKENTAASAEEPPEEFETF